MTHVEQEICETSRCKNHRSSTGSESWIPGIRDRNGRAASKEFVSTAHGVFPPWLLHTEPVGQLVQEGLAAGDGDGCAQAPKAWRPCLIRRCARDPCRYNELIWFESGLGVCRKEHCSCISKANLHMCRRVVNSQMI